MKMDTSTEAVERLLDGVTPGDWSSYSDDDDPDCPAGFQYSLHSSKYGCVGYWTGHKDNHKDERWYLTEADARFIAAARDLVPALLKERDEARAALAEVEAALAAQIEAAIREMWCLCEDLEDEAYAKLKLKLTEHEQGFWTAQKMTAKRIRRATQMPTNDRTALDRMLAAAPAAVAPSLRITGPNSDGEYWLHIKAGGRSGGVNLGGEHGPICKRLLDAASETGAKE